MSVYIALNACYFLSATNFFDEFFCLLRLCISYLSATVFYHDVARREQCASHRTCRYYLVDGNSCTLAKSATYYHKAAVCGECVCGVYQAVDTCRAKQQTHEA